MGKPEGRVQLVKPSHRWEDNFKMDLKETGWEAVDWINLAHDRNK
jgi:hypothetical protein